MLLDIAYIGLGSNLKNPSQQIKDALRELHQSSNICVQACSHLYKSKPLGPQNQPLYTNAVCKLNTSLSPIELLDVLQSIETNHKRERNGEKWGPRTLDLDILLFNQERINCERLKVPHIGMQHREFVLVPLFEIAPDLVMHDGRSLAAWINDCDLNGLKRLNNKIDFASIAA
ncbi:2-amino-4-hydroxy-6-hydroxymethyldihydropteridine diphosphokinase [Glaciecola sp. 1036]|uniref:2-amino-4-hydroxy-6- hydroxymethyldihydropteridine diphosphokinase n=1 Tax=Alteromonadaceae TaxID=72275 RepID=UPI003D0325E9